MLLRFSAQLKSHSVSAPKLKNFATSFRVCLKKKSTFSTLILLMIFSVHFETLIVDNEGWTLV